jgi:hypothetical protein
MIHRGTLRAFVSGVVLLATASAGHAAATETAAAATTVRSGNHPDFGRVVIDTTDAHAYRLERTGDEIIVRFGSEVTLGQPPLPPKNVISIRTEGSEVDLTVDRGVQLHPMRIGGSVVLDILDLKTEAGPPAPVVEAPKRQIQRKPELTMASSPELGGRSAVRLPFVAPQADRAPVETKPPLETAAHSDPEPAVPEAMRQGPPARDVLPETTEGPLGLIARRVKMPKETDGAAFLVPFEATTGPHRSAARTAPTSSSMSAVRSIWRRCGTILCSPRHRCDCCRTARCFASRMQRICRSH